MKSHFITAMVLFFPFVAISQESAPPDSSNSSVIRTENNLKSGNTLDVLTNFFQLAFQDLTSTNKSFAFKSTLFGIKTSVDSSLRVDTNFRKQNFARNLQFEIGVHTSGNFKPVGMSGGLTYALINNRDRKEADFRNTAYATALDQYHQGKYKAENEYRKLLRDSLNNVILPEIKSIEVKLNNPDFTQDRQALNRQLDSMQQIRENVSKMRADFNAVTNGKAPVPQDLQAAYDKIGLAELHQKVSYLYDSLMLEKASHGLLTAGLYARTDSNTSIFNEGNLEFIYLKGLGGKRRIEADVRALIQCKDTLTPDNKYQFGMHLTGGANIIVLQSRYTHKSLLEIKPNLEFKSILSQQYPDQENYFFFNMDVRLRITDDIWIPVFIKYDIKNQNFLGFLNVSANLDALSDLIPG